MIKKPLIICIIVNSITLLSVAIYFFLWPMVTIINDVSDVGISNGEIPEFTYQWHKEISDNFPEWVDERLRSNRAQELGLNDVSGTEWPMFSAVYYLWATEELQRNWLKNPSVSQTAPIEYGESAIRAAAELIADEGNAAWVIKYWGADYLKRENLFYRMLLISGLTSYENLLSDQRYNNLLVQQASSLMHELDASPFGLLDDYPGQCYPVDIVPAISAIARAQSLIGADFSQEIQFATRGFQSHCLDPLTLLPAYIADSATGVGYGPARGVGMSYMLIWAPEIWPELAQDWYQKYEQHFWQKGRFISGVRELSHKSDMSNWLVDVDAGPVVAGYGTAASAFGIGAARANGRFDHAFPLSTQALATAWPLPNGTLLIPRLLSNLSDAPFIGETALLFTFTRAPVGGIKSVSSDMKMPLYVYFLLFIYAIFGALFANGAYKKITQLRHNDNRYYAPEKQLALWLLLVLFIVVSMFAHNTLLAIACLSISLLFPFKQRR